MNPSSGWRRSACVLIAVAALGMANTSAAQDPSPQDLRRRGRLAFDQGRYADAKRDLGLALQGFVNGANSIEIVQTLADLSAVLVGEQSYSDAAQVLDRGLAIMAMMPQGAATYPRETSRVMANLGALYQRAGQDPAAETVFNRALRLLEQYAPDDPHIAVVLSNLATLYIQNGKYKQAQSFLRRALAFAENRLGSEHPNFLPVLTNFAALYQRQKKWPLAESYLLRANRIAEHSLRPGHPERGLLLEHLGVVYHKRGKLTEAEMQLRRALDIAQRAFGIESIDSARVSLSLARVLAAQRRYDEARILYSDVLPIQERLLGAKAPQVAATLESFARLLHTMKSHKPADELEARARRIRAELAYTRSVNDSRPW